MSPVHDRELDGPDYRADLGVDFANEDQTGLIWAWLIPVDGDGGPHCL